MFETFLLLLAAGVMLAVVISDPGQVTLQWLRLAGILALVMVGLSVFAWTRRDEPRGTLQIALYCSVALAVLAQLALVQTARRRAQRLAAMVAVGLAITLAVQFFGGVKTPLDRGVAAVVSLGVAAMVGLALMDMLLGHAYLTASSMTMAPFRRLNLALGIALVVRAILATGGALALHSLYPVEMLWGRYGLLMITRWLVGLAVPAAFVYMAHDCIKRRATQSATGILYVAGILIFIGELLALSLARDTRLPF